MVWVHLHFCQHGDCMHWALRLDAVGKLHLHVSGWPDNHLAECWLAPTNRFFDDHWVLPMKTLPFRRRVNNFTAVLVR